MNAMNNETIEQKRFKEYLKNACGVTDIKIFFRNGDNDGNYPFCWAAIKALNQQEKPIKINGN